MSFSYVTADCDDPGGILAVGRILPSFVVGAKRTATAWRRWHRNTPWTPMGDESAAAAIHLIRVDHVGDGTGGDEAVTIRPINPSDLPRVAEFLHRELNDRVPVDAWMRAVDVSWEVAAPNHGMMLIAGDMVVGAYLAFYSERELAGRVRRVCNLGAWSVLPAYRFHSLKLLRKLLSQEGFEFTDLSPSGSVIALNERLGFQHLDTTTVLIPCLPWPSPPGRNVISSDPNVLSRTLSGTDLEVYRDHVGAPAARHLVMIRGGERCYVMFRKDRRKNLPLFASILYVSNPFLFKAMIGPLTRRLLVRNGVFAILAELRVVGARVRPSITLAAPRRKMFKSTELQSEDIDNLYSELVCISW